MTHVYRLAKTGKDAPEKILHMAFGKSDKTEAVVKMGELAKTANGKSYEAWVCTNGSMLTKLNGKRYETRSAAVNDIWREYDLVK